MLRYDDIYRQLTATVSSTSKQNMMMTA